MRARRRYKITAAFDEFHSEDIYILIAPVRVLNLACALAKSGRVENDQIEFFAVIFVFAQCLEHVRAFGRNIRQSVQSCVFFDVFERDFGYIARHDLVCGECGVERKSAAVAEAVENSAFSVSASCEPIFFLVEEVSRFLSVSDVHGHFQPVFRDDDFLGHFAVQHARALIESFFCADGNVAPLKNAFRLKNFDEAIHDFIFLLIDSER